MPRDPLQTSRPAKELTEHMMTRVRQPYRFRKEIWIDGLQVMDHGGARRRGKLGKVKCQVKCHRQEATVENSLPYL